MNHTLANVSSFLTATLWCFGLILLAVSIGGFAAEINSDFVTNIFNAIRNIFSGVPAPIKWVILGGWGLTMALTACVAAVLLDIMENVRKVADALGNSD